MIRSHFGSSGLYSSFVYACASTGWLELQQAGSSSFLVSVHGLARGLSGLKDGSVGAIRRWHAVRM